MYWGDFIALVWRNRVPNVIPHFVRGKAHPNLVTIADTNIPYRDHYLKTGHTWADWWSNSQVCNASYLGVGEIPRRSWVINEAAGEKVIGYKDTVYRLLKERVLRPTLEMDAIIGEDSRIRAPNDVCLLRTYY